MKYLFALAAIFAALAIAEGSVPVRKQAPAWKGKAVKNGEIVDLASSDFKGKWLVLFFYPLDFTFVCPTEIVEFNNKYAEFKKLGAEVVGVSVDSPHTHLAWTRTDRKDGGLGSIDFPLLSDITKRISSSYGVLVEDEADEHFGVTMRGTYIIDPEGVVRSFAINDEPVGRNIDEVMRLLLAAQHAAANKGQGCPANWKKGDKTIKANRKDSLEFFKQWM